MEFLDFELRIDGTEGNYSVAVLHSPVGEAAGTLAFSFDVPELKRRLRAVGDARDASVQTRRASDPQRVLILPSEERVKPRDVIEDFGRELFEALMPSEVRSCYRGSRNAARAQGKGLRVRLRIDAPELAALPWEYLYDTTEGDFICLGKSTSLIRHLEMAQPRSPLTIQPPLRILAMIASPSDLPKLNVELEKEYMAEAIHHLQSAGVIKLTWLEGQTWRDLQKAISGDWHVFHFIGHGAFDEAAQEGLIALADEHGNTYKLLAKQLGRMLADHASLRLVVLNCCESARGSETQLRSSIGAILTQRGIPAVVAMQTAISDHAALEFARTFYATLTEGHAVDAAVTEARMAINNSDQSSFEWGTPVVHMRSNDGRLFEIDVAGAIFPSTPTPPPEPTPPPAPVSTAPSSLKGLGILSQSVQQFWIEGVLENSLRHSGLIDVMVDTLPSMVDSPYGNIQIDPLRPIANICDELSGSFLILGLPGAGKTTMMLTLVQELLKRLVADPGRPIPVVFNLSSWTEATPKLADWLVAELDSKYHIPGPPARAWIQERRLNLFLDGLDEVNPGRRAACVEAINDFAVQMSQRVVVCCRFAEYAELPVHLTLNGAVRLRALTREQIAAHIERAGPALKPLQELLLRDSSLQVLAQTPFMLSLMLRTYRDLPPNAIDTEQFATVEARKQQLLAAYVQMQFRLAKTGGFNV